MPPRRPLPDLCLIAVFTQLTPNDQLKASKMSPRSAVLVRAANRRVKMLVITGSNYYFDGEEIRDNLNYYSLSSRSCMQLLHAKNGAEPFPDYPMTTTQINKWNCLLLKDYKLLDLPTIGLIVDAFSAVTDLKFFKYKDTTCENLIALLLRPEWSNQLTSLTVFGFFLNWLPHLSTDHRLIATINHNLPVLNCLYMDWFSGPELPHLTILAQLKIIAIDLYNCHYDHSAGAAFFSSLKRYAADNVELQVHFRACINDTSLKALLKDCSESLRSRIVCYGYGEDIENYNPDLMAFLENLLPSLKTFEIGPISWAAPQLDALLTALMKFPMLVHLELIMLKICENEHQPPRRPLAQLPSVHALDLSLELHSHSQVQWLDLKVTLPRLQAIHLWDFECASCNVHLKTYLCGGYSEDSKPSSSIALKCLCEALPKLHPGVPHGRIILGDNKPYPTLEQLLSASQ